MHERLFVRTVTIYTDGSYILQHDVGGWAASLTCGPHDISICGGNMCTSIDSMELCAIYRALHMLSESCRVNIFSDSQYAINCITEWPKKWKKNNWRTKAGPVKNQKLIRNILPFMDLHDINVEWVKAHSGIEENEKVDKMARQAAYQTYKEYAKKRSIQSIYNF